MSQKTVFRTRELAICLALLFTPLAAFAQTSRAAQAVASSSPAPNTDAAVVAASIPVGTTITIQNWQQYRDFMPDGMGRLFAGEFQLKMPADVQMEIGPTELHPPPKGYSDATEKYASQVKLIELPDGGLTLQGYEGGVPFPNPADPHKGWKVLANLWYRYIPYLSVDTHDAECAVANGGAVSCKHVMIVRRQLRVVDAVGRLDDGRSDGHSSTTEELPRCD